MTHPLIKHVSDSSFQADVLSAPTPVLVDFWAPWCGHCKNIASILDEIAQTHEGKLQIVKINVDENSAIPAQFGIRGIPTLMLFNNGQHLATKVGALSKAPLLSFINEHIA